MANTVKKQYVDTLVDSLSKSPNFVVINFDTLTHQTLEDLRGKLRAFEGLTFTVVKNSLLFVALKQAGIVNKNTSESDIATITEALSGPSALIIVPADWSAPLKAFDTFVKDFENVGFKVGVIEQTIYDAKKLVQLAQLPSKEELYAKILGSLKAPQTKMVFSMKYNISHFVRVLGAMKEQKSE